MIENIFKTLVTVPVYYFDGGYFVAITTKRSYGTWGKTPYDCYPQSVPTERATTFRLIATHKMFLAEQLATFRMIATHEMFLAEQLAAFRMIATAKMFLDAQLTRRFFVPLGTSRG